MACRVYPPLESRRTRQRCHSERIRGGLAGVLLRIKKAGKVCTICVHARPPLVPYRFLTCTDQPEP